MRSLTIVITVIASVLSVLIASGQERVKLRFYDSFDRESSVVVNETVPTKNERVSSDASAIKINWLSDFPDSVKRCINLAVDMWESRLHNMKRVVIEVALSPLGDSYDVITDVLYFKTGTTAIPCSLYKQQYDLSTDNYDAVVTFNSDVSWNCEYGSAAVTGFPNATTAMLRAIAVALGFGSSVTERSGGVDFQESSPSLVDGIVFSSTGERLTQQTSSTALAAYVSPRQGTSLYAGYNDKSYKLYAPQSFEPGRSLVYLDNAASLMHHDLASGSRFHRIDTCTVNVLNAIGWNLASSGEVTITGVGIPDTGITSGYESHVFKVTSLKGGAITDGVWEYRLPLAAGGDSLVIKQTGSANLTIPPVDDSGVYAVNINGDIYGVVSFSGKIGGKAVSDSYRVSLELAPVINSVTFTNKVYNESGSLYNQYMTVNYSGSDYLVVSVEDEISVAMETNYYYQPFLAHVIAKNIKPKHYSWVHIVTHNNYGSVEKSVEIPPVYTPYKDLIDPSEPVIGTIDGKSYEAEAVDISGNVVARGDKAEVASRLAPGFYVINLISGDRVISQFKYLKK